jgi:hypothetical protein
MRANLRRLPQIFLEFEVKPRFVLEFEAANHDIALSPNDDVRCGNPSTSKSWANSDVSHTLP